MKVLEKLHEQKVDITGTALPNAFDMKKHSSNNYITGLLMELMQLSCL